MRTFRVLIVDDSIVMRYMIAKLFEQDAGFTVVGFAVNGADALDKIVELQPELVTLDIEMPDMDGFTALKQIMSFHPVPVMMLSSYTEEGSNAAMKALEYGAMDFFQKESLFQKERNIRMEEEFLLRCRTAMRKKQFLRNDTSLSEKENSVKIHMEMLTFLLKLEEDMHQFHAELHQKIKQQNGLLVKFRKVQNQFIYTQWEGSLFSWYGIKESDVVGKQLGDVFPAHLAEFMEPYYHASWEKDDVFHFETEWHGSYYSTVLRPILRNGTVIEVISLTVDITVSRSMEERIRYLTHHDPLTGLPNRHVLTRWMEDAIAQQEQFAIIFVNLDHFKLTNETLGHETGDRILQVIARRLKNSLLIEEVHVFRVGSDEFIGLVKHQSQEELDRYTSNIIQNINQPIRVLDHEVYISPSIGISQYPQDEKDPESLIRFADIAMNYAKELGGNQVQHFNAELHVKIERRMKLEKYLRKALERNEFILVYQPQVEVSENRIVGFESLIRWESPVLGRVSPMEFIPIAEETGLIYPIGKWLIEEACAQNKRWQDMGLPKVSVAVNLSSKQFFDRTLQEQIGNILLQTGLEPQYLELEITESMAMDVQVALATLHSFRSMGLKIAMDDFGTGYSSLSYLKKFPINHLKIDQSFVKEISKNPTNAAIVNTIITLAHNLEIAVIAEGVEHEEDLKVLQDFNCPTAQGYLFSPPIEASEVPELFTRFGMRTKEASRQQVMMD
ncbi:EAL domain-containing protein [Paenibacillus roseipurpureus]|uniref:EAL domain-containing protein n=1 Tax=Paenibacillus roseopurpureus TaxID=2918901 RepID=A0AA96LL89_9BACL|nr:EAL domain-containing protein [Paenibacillus sp. MBLB1832]WNR42671.1 EAL domain-containing protein [Paenibacillus sp. MBLB1832]